MNRRWFLLGPLALVFLVFGCCMLAVSYHQNHPTVFLALFFSSSLIILLSAAMLIGLACRFFWPLRPEAGKDGKAGEEKGISKP